MASRSDHQRKQKKLNTALLSIIVSILLVIIKLVIGILTNSISILASAVDSFLDLSASCVNYYSIKKSEKPADREHKFGHGKAEGLASLFQSFIIGTSSIYLIYLSIDRLLHGGKLVSLGSGIIIIAISILVSSFMTRYIKRVATQTDSIALHADSLHYRFDVYANIGIIIGLITIKLTGLSVIDPVISILIAVIIIWAAKKVVIESVDILMDRELSVEIVQEIERVIMKYKPMVRSFHKLRTRNAGSIKFIEFHVVLDEELTFVRSHELAEEIIMEIESTIHQSEVTVHVDPDKHPDYS